VNFREILCSSFEDILTEGLQSIARYLSYVVDERKYGKRFDSKYQFHRIFFKQEFFFFSNSDNKETKRYTTVKKKKRQYSYSVTLKRVQETIFAVEKQ
jgi:hypothetical protein